MHSLPIPPLAQTLDQYLDTVRPLLSDEQNEETQRVVDSFRESGAHLQDELILCDEDQVSRGSSWLSTLWFDTYMRERRPLTQSTNVAFELEWPFNTLGATGAAEFTERLTSVYLKYLRGEWETEFSPRGASLTNDQWRLLTGGIRVRRRKKDRFEDGAEGAAGRHIVALRHGHAFVVPVSDDSGAPLTGTTLAKALGQVVHAPDGSGDFTLLSHLDAADAVKASDELWKDPHNRTVQKALKDALFVLDLSDNPTGHGIAAALKDLAFGVTATYALKPASFQFGLDDGFAGVNLEHSTLDGATLQSLVVKAQEATPDPDPSPLTSVSVSPLEWQMDKKLRRWIEKRAEKVVHAARGFHVDIIDVPFQVAADVRYSADAAMQWVLLYASLATWGTVRSTYEAVDMREFQAGRTESFRPHTQSAIDFVSALIEGNATWEQYEAAARAHSQQVKNAKTGDGIERHLYGLQEMARSTGEDPEFFTDAGYKALTKNFFSTTSLGVPKGIIRMAFAPAVKNGVGVNYTRLDGAFEYCLTFDGAAQGEGGLGSATQDGVAVDAFESNLAAGAEALSRFLNAHNPKQ